MVNVNDALKQLNALNVQIEKVVRSFGYESEDIEYDYNDLDQSFYCDEIRQIANTLDQINKDIAYLAKPVVDKGIIHHNSSGRYELPSGEYFASGSMCEILHYNNFYEKEGWCLTRIEHNGSDYYATALGKDVSIDGKEVRIRR